MRRSIAAILVVLGAAGSALGEDLRQGPLEGQPAVRKRWKLRDGRFEIGPAFGFTLGQPFKHTLLVGVKAEYHLLDWLSFGAVIAFRGATFDSGLTKEVDDVNDASLAGGGCDKLTVGTPDYRACILNNSIRDEERTNWKDAQNDTAWAAAIRGVVTPFSGKLALFSRLFWLYDFYGFGGVGVIKTANKAPSGASLENDGTHIGPHFGVGMHVFFTPSIAMSIEWSDTLIKNNPTGRNVNLSVDNSANCRNNPQECDRVDGEDARTMGYYTVLFGASAYLPFTPKRTK